MNLDYTIQRIFQCYSRYGGSHTSIGNRNKNIKFLEIPIEGDEIEIPIFALREAQNVLAHYDGTSTTLVVPLTWAGYVANYRTLSPIIENFIGKDNRGMKFIRTNLNNLPEPYYITFGAIFDSNFKPVMICSWRCEKTIRNDSTMWEYKTPILRISKSAYWLPDSMKTYLTNKFLRTVCDTEVFTPADSVNMFSQHNQRELEIRIQNSPFPIKIVEKPSLELTRDNLINLALDNLDEIVS